MRVAISMRATRGPWGGASTFVAGLAAELRKRRHRVVFDLKGGADVIVLIDPKYDHPQKVFGPVEIRALKYQNPAAKVLHRINECDQRKGTRDMDPLLQAANGCADHTAFISEWLLEYHAAKWFDVAKPHSVIYNGADPRIFHPEGNQPWRQGTPMRLVTHHWSDNPLKGFDIYEALDGLIADGTLKGVEFWIIGRWPEKIRWKAAKTFPPMSGRALAGKLRECHMYVTATRWEPCGMHHVEGAQCGLPLLYHEDGGGVVEAGKRYGIGFRGDLPALLERARASYSSLRKALFKQMPSGDRMTADYADLIESMIR